MVKNLETFTNHNHVNVERNAFNDIDKDYYKDGEDQDFEKMIQLLSSNNSLFTTWECKPRI